MQRVLRINAEVNEDVEFWKRSCYVGVFKLNLLIQLHAITENCIQELATDGDAVKTEGALGGSGC